MSSESGTKTLFASSKPQEWKYEWLVIAGSVALLIAAVAGIVYALRRKESQSRSSSEQNLLSAGEFSAAPSDEFMQLYRTRPGVATSYDLSSDFERKYRERFGTRQSPAAPQPLQYPGQYDRLPQSAFIQ